MKDKIKVAILGCGTISDFHVKGIEGAGGEVAGVFDRNEERKKAVAGKYGVKEFADEADVFSSDCDVVAVCTPSGTHADLAIAALKAGKHVVVEKPLALTYEDCERIIAARGGRICAPVSQLRFSPSVIRAKKAIDDGLLGKITLVTLSMKYYRSAEYYAGGWRGTKAADGGGALMNQGIHGVDLMRMLAGDVTRVCGLTATLAHDIETEDTAVAAVAFGSGALGTIDAATSVAGGYPRRLEICGDKGSILFIEDELVRTDAKGLEADAVGGAASGCADPTAISYDGHRRQYEDVFAAIRGEKKLAYTAEDAAKTVRLITAVYDSFDAGKTIELN